MMQAFTQLSPGYYDLIIADESHRSIYNRYVSFRWACVTMAYECAYLSAT